LLASTFSSPAFAFTNPSSRSSVSSASFLQTSNFVPSFGSNLHQDQQPRSFKTRRHVGSATEEEFNPEGLVPITKDNTLTPEGYGFTAPAKRIVTEASRANKGYYRASSTESVANVIDTITSRGGYDVALVFDGDEKMVGLFTETDYIKV